MDHTWRRCIERFTIGDLEDLLYRTLSPGCLTLQHNHLERLVAAPYQRRIASIQLDSTQVSKLRSGKADGVSAQHTGKSLFGITGTASRQSGPLMPKSSLDLEAESFASAQRQKIHCECGPQPSQRFSAHVSYPLGPSYGAVYESRTCQHRSFIKTNSRIQR